MTEWIGDSPESSGASTEIDGQLDRMDGQFDRIDAALAVCAESARLTVHYVKVLCKQRGIEFDPA